MTLRELNPRARRRPKIRTRTRSGPVNRNMLVAVVFAGGAYLTWPNEGSEVVQRTWNTISLLLSGACCINAVHILRRDYRLRRNLAISEAPTDDHGSARVSTPDERQARGMGDFTNGELLGRDENGKTVWRPESAPFMLVESVPGGGKTSAFVINSILHRAMLGYSVVVPDVKTEIAVMLVRALRRLGFEVWCINPAGKHVEITGDTVLNPYQALIDAASGDAEARKNAFKLGADYSALHIPQAKEEKQPYFTFGARRTALTATVSTAIIDPANCTPTASYALLADPSAFLERCGLIMHLRTVDGDNALLETLRIEAKNLLYRAKKNEENFASFLEQASQRLISFNPSGHLAHYGREALLNIKEIRERQVIVFIMTPLSHMREFGDFISLLNHNVIAACKAKPAGHPVHIVGEEALNYRFTDLVSDLETMRQLRVTADFYIQSFAGLERAYGKEAAAAIESYADVRVYAGLNSFERAKHVSDMLAEETLCKQDVSHDTAPHDLNIANKEIGRRLMTPDEILAMPRDEGWLFVRGLRPTKIRLTTYAQVLPWSDWVAASPITDTRLWADPIVTVDYPPKEERP